ncbi:OLC1v1010003C1 [Oldenlandia corymbosa var. corymbosa]|uniref:OLC1v1010003C1 n=1 Tax=Oldenlandia corymbosa var. corymbosa TaxID=529605 RepID=A0AAV1DQ83_OLDCO|nr:OLC1v1010003C1 [Oldenlandia corymbosa var. corymbosa]
MATVFSVCSLLMAFLFAVSASFQLNDPDWYFWFPLYTCGCIVNLANGLCRFPKTPTLAKLTLWLGVCLFIKVAVEGLAIGGVSVLWSIDMRERVVREKNGSGLVTASMYVHLMKQLSRHHQPTRHEAEPATLIQNGMLLTLVTVGYGVSVLFYLRHHQEMRF